MNTIEPLQVEWKGEGIETDDNYQSRLPDRTWDETSDFLFHRGATELCDEVSPYTLQEKYSEIVETEIKTIKEVLPIPEERISMGGVSAGRRSRVYYVRGDTVIVPSNRFDRLVHFVSENKNAARDLRGKLVTELENKSEQYHGAGIEDVNILTGEEYTFNNIEHSKAEIEIKQGEPEDFEQQILDELKPLSEAFTSNVTVSFVNYSPEPEFDILYNINPHQLIQIEVKDYSGTDDKPGKSDVIHKPLRRASLLDVYKTFTVVKGVSEEEISELKKNSEIRGQIELIKKHEVTDAVQPLLERSIVGGPPGFLR